MAIATLSTKDPRDAAVSPQVLFVPLSQSFAVCAAAAPSQPAVVLRDDSPAALSPRLTHEVKADYNEEGVHKRLEGHVEMEAIVSPGGCVSWARVVRSLGVLDIQAIDAVLQWEFDPGRVSGRPVPVRVNIDLAFTLK